jgi:5-methylcytosine-specific restriction endonuclease McrA
MATYDKATLRRIYDRTTGKCHICCKKLAFTNYGQCDARGGWEVEHSVPKAKGGSDRLSNLYAAHTSCNRSKQHGSTRTARAGHGRTRAPLSVVKRRVAKAENTTIGAGIGAAVGVAIAGPVGAWIGGGIGAYLGNSSNPDL